MLSDILASRVPPRDIPSWRAELLVPHRVRERGFLISLIPENSVGAELGVFTGLFSALIARQPKITKVSFVDPWWLAFGETYPAWGPYTDYGHLLTRTAHALATKRVQRSGLAERHVVPASSYEWLEDQPDHSLDWVYLDSTHTYEGTRIELALLERKIKPDGVILGDDWQADRTHRHHGVCLAVNEFASGSDFELAFGGVQSQWMLRRALKEKQDLPMLWADTLRTEVSGEDQASSSMSQ